MIKIKFELKNGSTIESILSNDTIRGKRRNIIKDFDLDEIMKTLNKVIEVPHVTRMKFNYKTYRKLLKHIELSNEFKSEMALYGMRFDIDDSVADNIVKIIYNNGEEKEMNVFKEM